MRRLWKLSLPLLLAALLLAACSQSAPETPPAANTAPETEKPEAPEGTPGQLPEGAVTLSAEEIVRVNEAFAPFEERDGVSYIRPLTCLVSSCYRYPEELDLSALLRHFPSGAELSGEAEFEALKAAEGWPFGDIAREQMPVPVSKFLRSDVDAYLKEHMGITTEHLYAVPYDGPGAREYSRSSLFFYLPEYEAYYNFVSDADPGCFQCASGWYSERMARLTGDSAVLTLEKRQDGSWYFCSFLPARSAGE